MIAGGPSQQMLRAMPVLEVRDLSRSLAFYKDKLGFDASTWGEPANFAIVQRGTVTVALVVAEEGVAVSSRHWAVYLYVSDVDALHDELAANGIILPDAPVTQTEYTCRDFTIKDPDGHLIGFGQVYDADPLGPGLSARTGRDRMMRA